MGNRTSAALGVLLAVAMLPGCSRPAPDQAAPAEAATPAEAVRRLTADLRANDLDAFATHAVTPAVHARLQTAWREGRTRWPLDQLPFARHLPRGMAALSAPDAEQVLQRGFERQLADASLGAAAEFLTLFTVQYILQQGEFSVSEREHYPQLVQAFGAWAAGAPIGDRDRARAAIATMTAAAREARLDSDQAFAEAGMEASLQRMSRVLATGKQVLASYGFDLDADLAAMDVQLQSQTGDVARVRMQYALAGTPIDTVVNLERRDGVWYVSDFLRHAEDAVARAD
ncbi:hypothetical protein [uncultured Luteimonas sp.]|uniref:hypothetical protein n=1 Tax=uncultured Luteimonas sp. TaxID=453144 RepID=UPI0026288A84|nr:hypothetical protein [uncultured Luteimonas sp.]